MDAQVVECVLQNGRGFHAYLARERLLAPLALCDDDVGVLADADATAPSDEPRPSPIFPPSLLSGASFRFSAKPNERAVSSRTRRSTMSK